MCSLQQHPEPLMLMMLALGEVAMHICSLYQRPERLMMLMVLARGGRPCMMLMMLALHSPALLQLAATHRAADADDARSGGTTFAACNNAQSG